MLPPPPPPAWDWVWEKRDDGKGAFLESLLLRRLSRLLVRVLLMTPSMVLLEEEEIMVLRMLLGAYVVGGLSQSRVIQSSMNQSVTDFIH